MRALFEWALLAVVACLPRSTGIGPPDSESTLLSTCPNITAPADGTIHKTGLTYMATAQYGCKDGYSLKGMKLRQCQADGQWDGSAPVCVGSCPSPQELISGVRSGATTYRIEAKVDYACNNKFTLVGSSSLVCGSITNAAGETIGQQWVGTMPMCKFDGDPVQERTILMRFFDTTNGPRWLRRTRRVNAFNDNDLYSSWRSSTSTNSHRLTEGNIDPEYKPMSLATEQRSIGWNTSSVHGCNTATCHCSWFGVTCNDRGLVTKLELPSNGLSGFIADELGGLPYLDTIDLGHNEIEGTIPAAWGEPVNSLSRIPSLVIHGPRAGLESLRILRLNANKLVGSIPNTLSNLTSIEELHLNDNQLTGLMESWTKLKAMKNLRLHGNVMQGTLPSSMGDMSQLKLLAAQNNFLTGSIPTSLGYLKQLSHLDLSNNYFQGELPTYFSTIRYLSVAIRSQSPDSSPCDRQGLGPLYHCGWQNGVKVNTGIVRTDHELGGGVWQGGVPVVKSISPTTLQLNVPTKFIVTGGGLSTLDTFKMIHPATPCHGVDDHDSFGTSYLDWVTNSTNEGHMTLTLTNERMKADCVDGIRVCYRHEAGQYVHVRDITCSAVGHIDATSIKSAIPTHLTPTEMGSPGLTWAQQAAAKGG